MGLLDLAVTVAAWFVSLYLRFHSGWFPFAENAPPGMGYAYSTLAVTMLLTMLIFGWMGLYRPRRIQSLGSECWDIVRACALAWVLEVVISHFLHKPRVSILLQATFAAVWPAMLFAYRGSARLVLRASGARTQPSHRRDCGFRAPGAKATAHAPAAKVGRLRNCIFRGRPGSSGGISSASLSPRPDR